MFSRKVQSTPISILFFDSLKSYSQVSSLLTSNLHTPEHIEVVMSPKGMYDYFSHAENPEKTPYDINDIVSGCGFDLQKFIMENNHDIFLLETLDIIENYEIEEFDTLVQIIRELNPYLLMYITKNTYFFARLVDSRRYKYQEQIPTKTKFYDKSKIMDDEPDWIR